MSILYPANTIWLVEASSSANPGATPKFGSAIVVWLRERNNNEDTGRRYLLTAQHVVRGIATIDGKDGFGTPFDQLLVWGPEKGYTALDERSQNTNHRGPNGSYKATIASLSPIKSGEIPVGERVDADDWVLLEVDDHTFKTTANSISGWETENKGSSRFWVLGYPGGAASWKSGDLILPHASREFRIIKREDSIIHSTGPEETRPGMSGGGMFDSHGNLIGVHRASFDSAMQYRCISTKHIREQLSAKGYDLVPQSHGKADDSNRKRWKIALVLIAAATAFAFFIGLRLLGDPPKPPPKPPAPINSNEFMKNIVSKSIYLSPDEFTEFRTTTENTAAGDFDFGRLLVADVRPSANGAENWVFSLVPPDCSYMTEKKGQFEVEVAKDLLPDDFHYSNFKPVKDSHRVIQVTGRIKRVFWLSKHTTGTVLIKASGFRNAGEKISCEK